MIIYGINCNSGRIHRNEQTEYDPDAPKLKKAEEPTKGKRDNKRAVVRIEDGKRYESIRAATADVGLKQKSSIWQALQRGGTAAGYHWRYA